MPLVSQEMQNPNATFISHYFHILNINLSSKFPQRILDSFTVRLISLKDNMNMKIHEGLFEHKQKSNFSSTHLHNEQQKIQKIVNMKAKHLGSLQARVWLYPFLTIDQYKYIHVHRLVKTAASQQKSWQINTNEFFFHGGVKFQTDFIVAWTS